MRFFSVSLRLCVRSVASVTSLSVLSILSVTSLPLLLHAQPPPPNVLLITIDTVRADHLGAYGYQKGATPALDRLAHEGVTFLDATSQAPLTGPAHAALLTGMFPARLGVRDNASTPIGDSVTTAAKLFKAHGYRTGAFVGAFILTAPYGFAQGFDTFDADFAGYSDAQKLQVQRLGGSVIDAALKWLNPQSAIHNPQWFAWVHLYDAHAPYDAPAPFGARFKSAPYDGEIAYVDACIAQLIADLERLGQLDRTIVAVVADHGESLGEHGEQEHGMFLYEPVLHIPWIMRLPAHTHAGERIAEQVRAIDLLPTLAALTGAAMPRVDGESLVGLIEGRARREVPPSYAETFYPKWHYGWSELKSIRADGWKYVDAPRPELYDMRSDAAERRNAADTRAPLAAGLRAALGTLTSTFGAAAVTTAPQPDAETLARLRSLGYVGMAGASSGARGADPKDMIAKAEAFRIEISRAMDALAANRPAAAVAQLKPLVADNSRSFELHLFLGDAYVGTREWDNALGEYAAAALINPKSAAPMLSAARAYLARGDVQRAMQKANEAAKLEPRAADVSVVRGTIYERMGQLQQAIASYTAAVAANGSDPQARAHLASLAMRSKQYDIARPQFESLLRMGYRPSRMHFGLAQIAEAKGDPRAAVAEYREAIRLEPSFADAKAALARLGGGQ